MKTHDELDKITNKIIADMAGTYGLTTGESLIINKTITDYITTKVNETYLETVFRSNERAECNKGGVENGC